MRRKRGCTHGDPGYTPVIVYAAGAGLTWSMPWSLPAATRATIADGRITGTTHRDLKELGAIHTCVRTELFMTTGHVDDDYTLYITGDATRADVEAAEESVRIFRARRDERRREMKEEKKEEQKMEAKEVKEEVQEAEKKPADTTPTYLWLVYTFDRDEQDPHEWVIYCGGETAQAAINNQGLWPPEDKDKERLDRIADALRQVEKVYYKMPRKASDVLIIYGAKRMTYAEQADFSVDWHKRHKSI